MALFYKGTEVSKLRAAYTYIVYNTYMYMYYIYIAMYRLTVFVLLNSLVVYT